MDFHALDGVNRSVSKHLLEVQVTQDMDETLTRRKSNKQANFKSPGLLYSDAQFVTISLSRNLKNKLIFGGVRDISTLGIALRD